MFGALAIGLALSVSHIDNQSITGFIPPVINAILLEDGSFYLQENGTSVFLLE